MISYSMLYEEMKTMLRWNAYTMIYEEKETNAIKCWTENRERRTIMILTRIKNTLKINIKKEWMRWKKENNDIQCLTKKWKSCCETTQKMIESEKQTKTVLQIHARETIKRDKEEANEDRAENQNVYENMMEKEENFTTCSFGHQGFGWLY